MGELVSEVLDAAPPQPAAEPFAPEYVAYLAGEVLAHVDEHNPSEGFRDYVTTTLDNFADHPDDTLAHLRVCGLRSFVLRRPLAEVRGPQVPLTPAELPAAEQTFLACVRRRDRDAVELFSGVLGRPAVAAICAERQLDLQWMHA
jgi:hypothetical protein